MILLSRYRRRIAGKRQRRLLANMEGEFARDPVVSALTDLFAEPAPTAASTIDERPDSAPSRQPRHSAFRRQRRRWPKARIRQVWRLSFPYQEV